MTEARDPAGDNVLGEAETEEIERHVQASVAVARVTFNSALSAGHAGIHAYALAREAMVDTLGPDIEVNDLDTFLGEALAYSEPDPDSTRH